MAKLINIINELAMIIGNVKTNPSLTAATCFCEFNLIATGTRKRSIPRSNEVINPIFYTCCSGYLYIPIKHVCHIHFMMCEKLVQVIV